MKAFYKDKSNSENRVAALLFVFEESGFGRTVAGRPIMILIKSKVFHDAR